MKLCVVQAAADRGDVARNVRRHLALLELACAHGADLAVFPELSLTGYEPTLAATLALDLDDPRLDVLQAHCDRQGVRVALGAPLRLPAGVCIGLTLLQPHTPRQVYAKAYLHPDEEPFFVPGPRVPVVEVGSLKLGLAICYELSVPEHAATAVEHGAEVYLASAAKTAAGVASAAARLAEVAATYGVPALFANGVGPADDFVGAGGSAVWNASGRLLAQLDATREGLLVFDTETGQVVRESL